MKKLLFTIVFLAGFILPAFTKAIDASIEKPEIYLMQNLGIPFVQDAKRDSLSLSVTGSLDFKQLFIMAGVQGTGGKADISAMTIFWPKFFEKWNIGPGLRLHLYTNNRITEYDFIPGLHIKYTGPVLEFYTHGGLFLKSSNVPALLVNNTIIDNSLLINIDFYWTVTEAVKVYFLIESSTFYDYFLFCTPIFTSGAEYSFWNKWSFGSNLAITFLDMFTVSSHYSQISVNTYIKVKIY